MEQADEIPAIACGRRVCTAIIADGDWQMQCHDFEPVNPPAGHDDASFGGYSSRSRRKRRQHHGMEADKSRDGISRKRHDHLTGWPDPATRGFARTLGDPVENLPASEFFQRRRDEISRAFGNRAGENEPVAGLQMNAQVIRASIIVQRGRM